MNAKQLPILSPFDLSEIATIETHPSSAIDGFFAKAISAAAKPLPKRQRIQILEQLAEKVNNSLEEIARLIAQEGGKPLVDARVEAARGKAGIRNAIDALNNLAGEEIPMGLTASSENRLAFTTHEPIGIVVAISAFNHPFNLIVHQVIPAIAAGCPVIVKPASATPLSCLKLVDMLHSAGLDEAWCQVALLDRYGAEALATDRRVNFLSFIGSAEVGWSLRSKLAPGTRCALEHGGAAPVIIDQSADIEALVPLLTKGGYYHAGQVCVSTQRIFIDNTVRDDFVEAYASAVRKLTVGDPLDEKTEVGPLILTKENDRVAQWVDEARNEGARVLSGGSKISDSCYAPTILLDPNADSKVSNQEIFGPVTCIYGYDKMDDAIRRANSLPLSFQSSVFAQDIDKCLYAARRLSASAVMINDHTAFRVDWMPFGGQDQSGLGLGGIPRSIKDMSQEKLVVIKSSGL